jgi:hypothetical protein
MSTLEKEFYRSAVGQFFCEIISLLNCGTTHETCSPRSLFFSETTFFLSPIPFENFPLPFMVIFIRVHLFCLYLSLRCIYFYTFCSPFILPVPFISLFSLKGCAHFRIKACFYRMPTVKTSLLPLSSSSFLFLLNFFLFFSFPFLYFFPNVGCYAPTPVNPGEGYFSSSKIFWME